MDDDTEVIKQQMSETRESLAGKLDALESKVMGTVQGATEAVTLAKESVQETVASVKDSVSDTVDTVKEKVQETVASIKDALDVTAQVQRRPWAMFAGAMVAGFVGGYLIGPPQRRDRRDDRWPPMGDGGRGYLPEVSRQPAATTPSGPSWLDEITDRFEPAISKLKEMAIGATTGLIGEMIVSNVPQHLRGDVSGVIDQFTTALGGKPVPLTSESSPSMSASDAPKPQQRLAAARGHGNGRGL